MYIMVYNSETGTGAPDSGIIIKVYIRARATACQLNGAHGHPAIPCHEHWLSYVVVAPFLFLSPSSYHPHGVGSVCKAVHPKGFKKKSKAAPRLRVLPEHLGEHVWKSR